MCFSYSGFSIFDNKNSIEWQFSIEIVQQKYYKGSHSTYQRKLTKCQTIIINRFAFDLMCRKSFEIKQWFRVGSMIYTLHTQILITNENVRESLYYCLYVCMCVCVSDSFSFLFFFFGCCVLLFPHSLVISNGGQRRGHAYNISCV